MRLIRKKSGFTIVELLIVTGIVGLLSTVLVVNIVRSRLIVNENTALNILVLLRNAATSYYSSQTPSAFPEKLEDLTTPISDPPFVDANLIDSIKGQNARGGYYFIYTQLANNAGFTIVARPTGYRVTGERSFLVDRYSRIFATAQDRRPDPQIDPELH